MKAKISLLCCIIIMVCSCTYWQPFPIKVQIKVVTTDNKPVIGHRVKVEQSLSSGINAANTNSKGEAILTITAQLDESMTDFVTVSGEETDLYLPITKNVFHYQRDDKAMNVNIVVDTVRYQKVRFFTKSNKVQFFQIRGHNLTTTEGANWKADKTYDYFYNDFWGKKIICNYKPIDTTITIKTGKFLPCSFSGFGVDNADMIIKETIKTVEYAYKAPRPDTVILVKY